MNISLLKAAVALAPTCLLFWGATILFLKRRTAGSSLKLLGAGGLMLVALVHICEALHLFPGMVGERSAASATTLISAARPPD